MKARIETFIFATVFTVGSIAIQAAAEAGEPDDTSTVVAVKMAMWTTAGVPSTDVAVDSLNGSVVLHGKVETAAERDAAERVARTVDGVKEVRNLVQVVSERRDDAVQDADDAIEARVKKAMADEHGLAGTHIKVESVNQGVVLLRGDARTLSEHVLAVETVHSVRGVRYVATQVTGPKGYTDDEIANSHAEHGSHHAYITTAVKLRLLGDSEVPALDISVDARGSTVILFGTVPTEAARQAAERDARKVSGVERVLNDLQVVPASQRKAVAARDDQVKDSVKKAIAPREELKKVDVAVKNGVVRLTGSVSSAPSRLRVAMLARSAPGVRSVDNDVQIKR
jgi:hyperosmotically inducible protein